MSTMTSLFPPKHKDQVTNVLEIWSAAILKLQNLPKPIYGQIEFLI